MRIEDLDTPIPIIDLDRVEHNIKKMQDYCNVHGIKLRPHIKTHKLPLFAYKQLETGAVGITCQKVSEAEVMAAAGIKDILITYNIIGENKIEPLARLAKSNTITVGLDNKLALDTVAKAAELAKTRIHILTEFESGNGRTGVQTPEEALGLAKQTNEHTHLHFAGLMTYPLGQQAGKFIKEAKQLFDTHGLDIPVVSAGGTPNVWQAHKIEGVTEIRVGTYIYHDRNIVGSGTATLKECALHVHATVVSRPTENRAILDAGSKTLSSDRVKSEYGEGYGLVLEYPDAVITRLNEEHGVIDLSNCQKKPVLGERVRIVPNHVCVVTNLHDEVVVHRKGAIEGILPVWARGKTR